MSSVRDTNAPTSSDGGGDSSGGGAPGPSPVAGTVAPGHGASASTPAVAAPQSAAEGAGEAGSKPVATSTTTTAKGRSKAKRTPAQIEAARRLNEENRRYKEQVAYVYAQLKRAEAGGGGGGDSDDVKEAAAMVQPGEQADAPAEPTHTNGKQQQQQQQQQQQTPALSTPGGGDESSAVPAATGSAGAALDLPSGGGGDLARAPVFSIAGSGPRPLGVQGGRGRERGARTGALSRLPVSSSLKLRAAAGGISKRPPGLALATGERFLQLVAAQSNAFR